MLKNRRVRDNLLRLIWRKNSTGAKSVPSVFLLYSRPFQYGSVFACSTASSSAAIGVKWVNTELFRNSPS